MTNPHRNAAALVPDTFAPAADESTEAMQARYIDYLQQSVMGLEWSVAALTKRAEKAERKRDAATGVIKRIVSSANECDVPAARPGIVLLVSVDARTVSSARSFLAMTPEPEAKP